MIGEILKIAQDVYALRCSLGLHIVYIFKLTFISINMSLDYVSIAFETVNLEFIQNPLEYLKCFGYINVREGGVRFSTNLTPPCINTTKNVYISVLKEGTTNSIFSTKYNKRIGTLACEIRGLKQEVIKEAKRLKIDDHYSFDHIDYWN
jgi:hypothetical protein